MYTALPSAADRPRDLIVRPRDLIVVLAFDPLHGLCDLETQLGAMNADATRLGYVFDRHAVRNELQAATFRLRSARTVRLLLGPSGVIAIEVMPDNSSHL